MEAQEIIEILINGEDSRHEFKSKSIGNAGLAKEMVAFSNTSGGIIFIGVNDERNVEGLSSDDRGRLNQSVPNIASDRICPPIKLGNTGFTQLPDGWVMFVSVPEGIRKPYMDNNTSIYIRNGANSQKIRSPEEILRMFQNAGSIQADSIPVRDSSVTDLDKDYFDNFYKKEYYSSINNEELSVPQLLENMKLAKHGELNCACILLFGSQPHNWLPVFNVKAVAFPGKDIEDVNYLDSKDIQGKLSDVYQQVLSFVLANLRHIQNEKGFNSLGEPEIPRTVFEELVTNALVHRDYFVSAPVKVLVFADRVEIISPGHLPNNLTIESIKMGVSNVRNPILHSFATKLLPYRGIGSGIRRAFNAYPDIELEDDRDRNIFSVIIKRNTYQ